MEHHQYFYQHCHSDKGVLGMSEGEKRRGEGGKREGEQEIELGRGGRTGDGRGRRWGKEGGRTGKRES